MVQPTIVSKEPSRCAAVRTAGISHVGHVRTRNEDSWGACDISGIAYVADGLGGQTAGDVASRLAGECIHDSAAAFRGGESDLSAQLFNTAAELAHSRCMEYAESNSHRASLATTLTAVRHLGRSIVRVLHIGDSRAYREAGGVLTPITDDHSWAGEAVRAGQLTREQARVHRNSNLISRCIGADPFSPPAPELFDICVERHERIILATDGLTDMLPEPTIASICGRFIDSERLVTALCDAALAAGGRDNITVVVMEVLQ